MTPPRPTRLVLLGHPVRHSLSPAFQNAALRRAALPLEYEALDVAPDALTEMVTSLASAGAAGNVTIPHKLAVMALCDRITQVARTVGAVNTFWVDHDGALVGHNTDVAGVGALLASIGGVPPSARIALLGAGGAAASVLAALAEWPSARVRVWNRHPERARALSQRFDGQAGFAESVDDALDGAAVVINATPAGMSGDELPLPVDRIPADARIVDLVYRRGGTAWVQAARARGHTAVDGLEMLLVQGAAAFECWFGVAPDLSAMRAAVGE
ncbi:MAG TPA: shikimate dehydrogenase [Gemmatimonadaceae bacterium]|nr:shikimate dehydrogenase [Gemmatimonadaceae bacterium]